MWGESCEIARELCCFCRCLCCCYCLIFSMLIFACCRSTTRTQQRKNKEPKNPKTERLAQVINGNAVQLQLEKKPEAGEGGAAAAAAAVPGGSCSPYVLYVYIGHTIGITHASRWPAPNEKSVNSKRKSRKAKDRKGKV